MKTGNAIKAFFITIAGVIIIAATLFMIPIVGFLLGVAIVFFIVYLIIQDLNDDYDDNEPTKEPAPENKSKKDRFRVVK